MKVKYTLSFLLLLLGMAVGNAQTYNTNSINSALAPDSMNIGSRYKIVTNDDKYWGNILCDDGREILIETEEIGQIYIAKSEIKKIKKLPPEEFTGNSHITSRYVFLGNGFQVPKGEHYYMLNLHGPEAYLAITDRFNIGVKTSWLIAPAVLSLKYCIPTSNSNINFSVSSLVGTSSWSSNFESYGGLGLAGITLGGRENNFTLAVGYGYYRTPDMFYEHKVGLYDQWDSQNLLGDKVNEGAVASAAGCIKLGEKTSFIFESLFFKFSQEELVLRWETVSNAYYEGNIYYPAVHNTYVERVVKESGMLMVIPGVRFQKSDRRAFQVSVAGLSFFNHRNASFPFPVVTWFRKF